MKKIDLGQLITILANVGVIAGIVFLGIELQQNNELLEAGVRANRHENRSQNTNRQFLANPELSAILVKANAGDSLTEVEQFIVERYFNQTLLDFEFIFIEYQNGQISEQDLSVATMRSSLYREAGMPRYWREHAAEYLRQDFVQWMNENVVTDE